MATLTVEDGGTYSALDDAFSALSGTGNIINIVGTWAGVDSDVATCANDSTTVNADSDARYPGYDPSSPSHYRLSVSGAHALTVNADDFVLNNVHIIQAGSGVSDEGIRMSAVGTTLTVNGCRIAAAGQNSDQDGIYNYQTNTINITNTIITGFYRGGTTMQCYTGSPNITLNINSCSYYYNGHNTSSSFTAQGGGVVVHRAGTSPTVAVNVFNTIALDNNTGSATYNADYHESGATGTVTWGISRSIDSDTSINARDSGGTGNLGSRTIADSDSGTGDYVIVNDLTLATLDLRLQDLGNSKNNAQDAHTDSSGEGLSMPSVDIIGTSRPQNTNYDIGAFEISASSAIDLVIADATHGHAADALTITQNHVLDISDASHAHSADSPALTQLHILSIADSLHAHAADGVVLSVDADLSIADALHGHLADSPSITQEHELAIADALHGHIADTVAISTAIILSIADALHAHSVDSPELTQAHILDIQEALHTHAADGVTITQNHILIISDALHAHIADNVSVYLPNTATTPDQRVFVVESENRMYLIARENRTFVIH